MKNESEILDEATVGAARWHGAVEGIYKQLVYGWAFDRDRPDARVVIEICRDDVPFACILSDVARTDLTTELEALGAPDLCHGFVADLGALPASSGGTISARVANTAVTLVGSFQMGEPKTPPAAAINSVFGDGGLRLHGWALDPSDQKRTVTVRAFVDNEMVAQAAANIIHPSMRGYIDGAHGFDLSLPTSLADGNVRSVRVVDEDGRPLNGSPLTICSTMDGIVGLLPDDSSELLLTVADIYQRHLPRSLPMSTWHQWLAHFDCEGPRSLPKLRTAVIVTGGEDADLLRQTLESLQLQHGMVAQVFSAQPFNAMLVQAIDSECDVICCVRAGDTLARHALAYAMEGFLKPETQVVYTDSEFNGTPWFKPAWDADYALATDYPLDLLFVRASVTKNMQSIHSAADFAWTALMLVWSHTPEHIVHVPRVLYQLKSPLSELERAARMAAATVALRAIHPEARLEKLKHVPRDSVHAARRVHYVLPGTAKDLKVSLIIPTRDRVDLLKRCIDTIRAFTPWTNLEIIIIDNGSKETSTLAYFDEVLQQGVRVLPMPGAFNYADLNNRAVALAEGDIVGLINNDIEALHDGWLEEILSQLLRPGVGAVGAKLLWPNGMVQHGGVLLGVGNVAGHFGNRLSDSDWGDHGRNQLVQQVSGCTAACLFIRKQEFLELGGMDVDAFPVAFNDVDLCLKVRASGKLIIWTPHAKLLHAESASRGHEDTPQKKSRALREVDGLRRKWGHMLLKDPAYHPCLNLDPHSQAFNGLAVPPRGQHPRNSLFEAGHD
jgi:GT2 family glycosyltransferase